MMVEIVRVRHRPGAAPPSRVTPAVKRPMSRTEIVEELSKLRETARRLRPPLPDKPDQWHEDKSDLVHAIMLLEDAVRENRPLERPAV
jgi:hypothetical protein